MGPVRLCGVSVNIAFKAHNPGNKTSDLNNADVGAAAHVDVFKIRVVFQQEYAGFGHVVHMQEFAQGVASAPDGHLFGSRQLGFAKAPDQRRDHMAVFRMIIIAWAVQIGGHGADRIKAILLAVCLAHLDSRDFRQGVCVVGGFQRSGEQASFLDRLGAHLGVEARRSEKQQLPAVIAAGAVNDVILYLQVLVDKLCGIGGIGMDAAHLGGSKNHNSGPVLRKKVSYGGLIAQIQLRVCAREQVFIASTYQRSAYGAAHKAAMSGHIDRWISVHAGLLVMAERPEPSHLAHGITHAEGQVFTSHFGHHVFKGRFWFPAQFFFGLGRIAQQGFHLGGTEVAWVHPHNDIAGLT